MKLLQNRGFAGFLMVLLIVGSCFLGVWISLDRQRGEAQELYYESSDGFGSIGSYMETVVDCSEQLAQLARQTALEVPETETVTAEIDAWKKENQPAQRYLLVLKLSDSTAALQQALLAANVLDNTDLQKLDRLQTEIAANTKRTINVTDMKKAGYNEQAEQFNRQVLGVEPARSLAQIMGFDALELIY